MKEKHKRQENLSDAAISKLQVLVAAISKLQVLVLPILDAIDKYKIEGDLDSQIFRQLFSSKPLAVRCLLDVAEKIQNDLQLLDFFYQIHINLDQVHKTKESGIYLELLGFLKTTNFFNEFIAQKGRQSVELDNSILEDQQFLKSVISDISDTNPLHTRSSHVSTFHIPTIVQTSGTIKERFRAGFRQGSQNKSEEIVKHKQTKQEWQKTIAKIIQIINKCKKSKITQNSFVNVFHIAIESLSVNQRYQFVSNLRWFRDKSIVIDDQGIYPSIQLFIHNFYDILIAELKHKRDYTEHGLNSLQLLLEMLMDALPDIATEERNNNRSNAQFILSMAETRPPSSQYHIPFDDTDLTSIEERQFDELFNSEKLFERIHERRNARILYTKFLFQNLINKYLDPLEYENRLAYKICQQFNAESKMKFDVDDFRNVLCLEYFDSSASLNDVQITDLSFVNDLFVRFDTFFQSQITKFYDDKSPADNYIYIKKALNKFYDIFYSLFASKTRLPSDMFLRFEAIKNGLYMTKFGAGYRAELIYALPSYQDKLRSIGWIYPSSGLSMDECYAKIENKLHSVVPLEFEYDGQKIPLNKLPLHYALEYRFINSSGTENLLAKAILRAFLFVPESELARQDDQDNQPEVEALDSPKKGTLLDNLKTKLTHINFQKTQGINLSLRFGRPESTKDNLHTADEEVKLVYDNILLCPYRGLPYDGVVTSFESIQEGDVVQHARKTLNSTYQSLATSTDYLRLKPAQLKKILTAKGYDMSKLVVIEHDFTIGGFMPLKNHKFVEILSKTQQEYEIQKLEDGDIFGISTSVDPKRVLILLEEVDPDNRNKGLKLNDNHGWIPNEDGGLMDKIQNLDPKLGSQIETWKKNLESGSITKMQVIENLITYLKSLRLTYTKQLPNTFEGSHIDYTLELIFKERKGVCRHSTLVIQIVLTILGIPCISVTGFSKTHLTGVFEGHEALNVDLNPEGGIFCLESTQIFTKRDKAMTRFFEGLVDFIFNKDLLEFLPTASPATKTGVESLESLAPTIQPPNQTENDSRETDVFDFATSNEILRLNKQENTHTQPNGDGPKNEKVEQNHFVLTDEVLDQTILKLLNNNVWAGIDENNNPYRKVFDVKTLLSSKSAEGQITIADIENIFIPFLIQSGVFINNSLLSTISQKQKKVAGNAGNTNSVLFYAKLNQTRTSNTAHIVNPPADKTPDVLLLDSINRTKLQLYLPIFQSIVTILESFPAENTDLLALQTKWVTRYKLGENLQQSLGGLNELIAHIETLI